VGQLKYTHHEMCVLVSSERRSNDVRYLSLYDNKYLRSFQRHNDVVSSIAMCPLDDTFLTASLDRSVIKWDLSSTTEIAKIQLPFSLGVPIVQYDSSGLVFGVMATNLSDNTNSIRLYDSRQLQGGPFQVISPSLTSCQEAINHHFPNHEIDYKSRLVKCNWTSFQFTSDGNNIFVNTDGEIVWLLDGYRPDLPPILLGSRKNEIGRRLGGCVSTDCKYILLGNDDNEIQVFSMNTKQLLTTMSGHVANVGCITFNPRYDMFASGCINSALWIPKLQDM
jgi:COMPASS component SWD2